jgi:hypothetical protein
MECDNKTTQLSLEIPKEEEFLEENIPLLDQDVINDPQFTANDDTIGETEEPKMEEIQIDDDDTPEVGTANNKKPSIQTKVVDFLINNFTYLYKKILHYTSCSLNNKNPTPNEPK